MYLPLVLVRLKNSPMKKKNIIIILSILVLISGVLLFYAISNANIEEKIITRANEFLLVYEKEFEYDFDYYQELNKDFRFILKLSDRELPVVQSADNEDYVRRNIWKEYDTMGSIMIDYSSSVDLKNIIIHGHSSTRNDFMFTLIKNKEYLFKNKMFTIETEEFIVNYQIISFYKTDFEKDGYYDMYLTEYRSDEDFKSYLEDAESLSMYDFGFDKEITGNETLITLITCNMSEIKDNELARYILIAVEVDRVAKSNQTSQE